jgi:hypothetical protein
VGLQQQCMGATPVHECVGTADHTFAVLVLVTCAETGAPACLVPLQKGGDGVVAAAVAVMS